MKDVVKDSLALVEKLYPQEGLQPEKLSLFALKPSWNVVFGTVEQCGLSMNFQETTDGIEIDPLKLKALVGSSLMDVAHTLLEMKGLKARSLAVATLSALSRPLIQAKMLEKRGIITHKADITTQIRPDDIVTMVGYAGIVSRVVGKCKEFHVTEMRRQNILQTLLIGEDVHYSSDGVTLHTEKENREIISRSDVVFITASTLANGTLDELLGYTARARTVIVYGPSGSIIPDVVLARGVDYLTGVNITDTTLFRQNVVNDLNLPHGDKSLDGQSFMAMTLKEKKINVR
jgi:uncharacterized protein (DUF4213/DUF364 family)